MHPTLYFDFSEAQFMYRRDRDHTLSSFIGEDQRIEEEEGEDADDSNLHLDDLDCYQRPQLDPISAGIQNRFVWKEKIQDTRICLSVVEDMNRTSL